MSSLWSNTCTALTCNSQTFTFTWQINRSCVCYGRPAAFFLSGWSKPHYVFKKDIKIFHRFFSLSSLDYFSALSWLQVEFLETSQQDGIVLSDLRMKIIRSTAAHCGGVWSRGFGPISENPFWWGQPPMSKTCWLCHADIAWIPDELLHKETVVLLSLNVFSPK